MVDYNNNNMIICGSFMMNTCILCNMHSVSVDLLLLPCITIIIILYISYLYDITMPMYTNVYAVITMCMPLITSYWLIIINFKAMNKDSIRCMQFCVN